MFEFLKKLFAKPTRAAGLFFSDDRHLLGAYQRKNGHLIISGLGGKQEASDPTLYYTAVRETLEELYDIKPSTGLINQVIHALKPHVTIDFEGYANFYLSFDQLNLLMEMVAADTASPIYRTMPRTITDLIQNRRPLPNSEISALALMPMESNAQIDAEFNNDIKHFKQLVAPRISLPI
jgi:hypothetical protein